MDRGLIVGAIAFVAAFGAERLYASMSKDIAKYEQMRRMSGQPPIWKELFTTVFGGAVEPSDTAVRATGFVADLTNDVIRYARLKSM